MKESDYMNIGKNNQQEIIKLDINTFNKHGFISGSSGSGKTNTIKAITQDLNKQGISTLLFDAKGDLKDLLQDNKGDLYTFKGKHGKDLTTSLQTLGTDLLSNLLDLNATQSSIIGTCYLIGQDKGVKLTTLQDLENLFNYIIINNESLSIRYGRISNVSINTIRRKINTLKLDKLEHIFNHDNFSYTQVINSKTINIIDSVELVKYPKLYASIITMILKQFYNSLSDSEMDQPKTVIFIDEAHLLFKDTNKNMVQEIEQVTRLIRSKGIGLFYISQSVYHFSDEVLSQLTTKIQHQLHLITTKDISRARALAQSFTSDRKNINQVIQDIQTLKVGRAFIQYEQDNQLISDQIQVNYRPTKTLTSDRLRELSPIEQVSYKGTKNRPKQVNRPSKKQDYQLSDIIILLLFIGLSLLILFSL